MKNLVRTAGLFLLSSIILFSCQEPEENRSFEVFGIQDSYEFAADLSQKETFKIESFIPWEITFDNLDWCDVTPWHNPGGTNTITIFPDNNPTIFSREGSFTITAEGYSKTVTVRQAGLAPELTVDAVSPLTCTFTGTFAGGEYITINSNCDWTIESSEWIGLDPSSGNSGVTKVKMTAAENTSLDSREGVIKILAQDICKEITVIQEGKPAEYLDAAPALLEFTFKAGTATVDISSNVDWKASATAEWISVSPASGSNDGKITVSVAANAGDAREGSVEITSTSGIKTEVKVSQEAKGLDPDDFVEYIVGTQYVWNAQKKEYIASTDWTTSGKKAADNSPVNEGKSLVYFEWITADNGVTYSVEFTYSSGQARLTGCYTGDGMVFHIPVKHVDAKRNIVLHYGMNLTGKKPMYWLAQYSVDGGKNWINIDTGHEYVTPGLKEYSNIQIPVKSTAYSFTLNCPITSALDLTDVLIRIMTPDGTIDINGSDPSELPAASGTCTFSAPEGYKGPTVELL